MTKRPRRNQSILTVETIIMLILRNPVDRFSKKIGFIDHAKLEAIKEALAKVFSIRE